LNNPKGVKSIKLLNQRNYKTIEAEFYIGIRAATNSTLAIGGVSSPLESFVVAESSVLRTNFCAEKPAHRQSAKRYQKPSKEQIWTDSAYINRIFPRTQPQI
jgi:hypothetical protein